MKHKIYKTSDIDTAVALKTVGNKLVNCVVEKSGRRARTFFVFEGETVRSDVLDFVNGNLGINDLRLPLIAFRELKNISHDAIENHREERR